MAGDETAPLTPSGEKGQADKSFTPRIVPERPQGIKSRFYSGLKNIVAEGGARGIVPAGVAYWLIHNFLRGD